MAQYKSHVHVVRQLRDKSFNEIDILSSENKCYFGCTYCSSHCIKECYLCDYGCIMMQLIVTYANCFTESLLLKRMVLKCK